MAEPGEDVFFDAMGSVDAENELFLDALEQAPMTWDYELREGYLIPEANLIGQVNLNILPNNLCWSYVHDISIFQ